ncbi:MAG: T9SS type A sorting domain-containing protein [Chitinivibrionales bacterium]|nr:T9SS type A sorting domain-containing protein [Chitinivibrionales bacterium]
MKKSIYFSVACCIISFCAVAIGAVSRELVGYWSFDQIKGDTVLDASTQGNNGLMYNKLLTNGVKGNCMSFGGGNRYVKIPASASLHVQNFSLIVWFYTADSVTPMPLVEFTADTGFAGPHFWINTTGYTKSVPGALQANIREQGADNQFTIATDKSIFDAGVWNCCAVVLQDNYVFIYANGVLVSEQPYEFCWILKTGIPIYFGKRPENSSDVLSGAYFTGMMDEIMLFNYALSADSVATIYTAAKSEITMPKKPDLQNMTIQMNKKQLTVTSRQETPYTVEIYDLKGKQMVKGRFITAPAVITIDLQNLAAGIYSCSVIGMNRVVRKTLIIDR